MSLNMKSRIATATSMSVLALVAGCGPSDQSVDPWVAPPDDFYKTLDSTEPATSALGGVGIRSGAGGEFEVARASGAREHSTDAVTFGDDNYTLVGDGRMSPGDVTDGKGGTLIESTNTYAGVYEYVMPSTFIYKIGDVSYTTTGFAGIITNADHVPVSGSATYRGETTGVIIASSEYFLSDGISAIAVDFGAGLVDVTLSDFTAVDSASASVQVPIDTVQITGMTIDGNTFTGGELTTLLGAATVELIGAQVSNSNEGTFFGWDSVGLTPDEVAGASVTIGTEGKLLFSFVGD